MATKTIGQLTLAGSTSLTDQFEIETAGASSFKATLLQMFTTGLTASLPAVVTTFSAVSGVTLSPASGTVVIAPTASGTVDNMRIGATTPSSGAFTQLSATAQVTLSPAVGNVVINPTASGTVDNMNIGSSTALPGRFSTLGATGTTTFSGAVIAQNAVSLSPVGQNITISPTGTGTAVINPAGLGSMNNMDVGQTTPKLGSFTQVMALGTTALLASIINNTIEPFTTVAGPTSGTVNIDMLTNSSWYFSSSGTANFTLNFRGSSGVTLSSLLSSGQSVTSNLLNTTGVTGFVPSTIQVDGTVSGVTTRWFTAVPTSGAGGAGSNGVDSYSSAILKTSNAPTWLVIMSLANGVSG